MMVNLANLGSTMKIRIILLCFVVAVSALPEMGRAAEPSAPPAASAGNTAQPPRDGERSGRRMRGGANFLERLKSQYPAEVAEIEKLRESDPEAAGVKMRELMSKAGFGRRGHRGADTPASTPGEISESTLAKLKEKYPAEFAQYEELKKSDPEKAAAKLRELLEKAGLAQEAAASVSTLRDRTRRQVEEINRELQRRDPETYARLEALRESDPDAARREFRRMAGEAGLIRNGRTDRVQYEYVPVSAPGNANSGRFNGRGGFPGGMMGPWGGGFGGNGRQRGR